MKPVTFEIGVLSAALLLVVTLSVLTVSCVRPPEKVEEPSPPPQPVAAAEEPKPEEPLHRQPPPSADEVQNKVQFIFEGAVNVSTQARPRYVVGDFNGDGSQDLAVVVNPVVLKLGDINSEIANWILGDPTMVAHADSNKPAQHPQTPVPVRMEVTDSQLMAIIHGHGSKGWRDPLSRQTYLLKNATGKGIRPEPIAEVLKTTAARKNQPQVFGRVKTTGDVIRENLGGVSGFLYYTGSKYAWYRQS